MKVLKINSSGRYENSVSRDFTKRIINEKIKKKHNDVEVLERDLNCSFLPFVTETMIQGFYIPEEERSEAQKGALCVSDHLVEELKNSDVLVMGVPIYNFGIPASLKAYIDLVCRVGLTFSYSKEGPKGLLTHLKAYLVIVSGGTEVGSDIDFASNYIKHVLSFIGIEDAEIIPVDRLIFDKKQSKERAEKIMEVVFS